MEWVYSTPDPHGRGYTDDYLELFYIHQMNRVTAMMTERNTDIVICIIKLNCLSACLPDSVAVDETEQK